jgi:hypothetical protein
MPDLTHKEIVLGLELTKIDVPKGYSLTIQYAPADPAARNAKTFQ